MWEKVDANGLVIGHRSLKGAVVAAAAAAWVCRECFQRKVIKDRTGASVITCCVRLCIVDS